MAGDKTWRVAAMSNDESGTMPRTVLLFSGHMIDAPGRQQPRFPADKESIARDAIVDTLTQAGAGAGGLPLCGAARGGGPVLSGRRPARHPPAAISMPLLQPSLLCATDLLAAGRCDR